MWGLFVGLILLAVIYYFAFDRNSPTASDLQYNKAVQHNVTRLLTESVEDLALIKKQLKDNPNELADTKHPYFVYDKENVVAWNKLQEIPPYALVQGNFRFKLISRNGYSLILSREALPAGQEIYSCIWVQRATASNNLAGNIQSGFNRQIFTLAPAVFEVAQKAAHLTPIYSPSNDYLFSIKQPSFATDVNGILPTNTLWLLRLAIIPLALLTYWQLKQWKRRHHYLRGLALLSFLLLGIRYIFLPNQLVSMAGSLDYFDALSFPFEQYYQVLGYKIINSLCAVFALSYMATFLHRSSVYYAVVKSVPIVKSILSVLLIVLTLLATVFTYQELTNIYTESDYQFQFGLTIRFSFIQLLILFYYILLASVHFLIIHLSMSLFTRIHGNNYKEGMLHWLYGWILGMILLALVGQWHWSVVGTGIIVLIIYRYNLAHYLYVFRYRTSIYFFMMALFFDFIGLSVVLNQELQSNFKEKQAFASRFFASSNKVLERELLVKARQMQSDTVLMKALVAQIMPRERAVERINEHYLSTYLGRYKTNLKVFDANGKNLDLLEETPSTIDSPTEPVLQHGNLDGLQRDYQLTVPIFSQNLLVGSVAINLQPLTNEVPLKSEWQEKRYLSEPDLDNHSFAIFDGTQLVQEVGDFPYAEVWQTSSFTNNKLFGQGIIANNYFHVGVRDKHSKRWAVISSPFNLFSKIFANLSFLFFISVVVTSLVLTVYGARYGFNRRLKMSFSTRLQLFQTAAFVIPLIIIMVFMVGIINNTFRTMQNEGFKDKLVNVSSAITLLINDLKLGVISSGYFEQELRNIARNTQTDLNFYQRSGKLVYTTRPLLYDFEYAVPYINAEALQQLNSSNTVSYQENLGSVPYVMVYKYLDPNASLRYNIIGIPNFYAEEKLHSQLNTWVSSVISPFIIIFIVLLGLSYLLARQLTQPLRTITQKIKRTNLNKLNEPLEWRVDDEIGLLTRAYNVMLKKLEENKMALSQSEKQTAWREMAKQVVHEIKNPLTPMKLSIQQLQRTLSTNDPENKQRIERALNSLTEQIDNISEIANSFSEFAKMPVPRSEIYDLVTVLQKTVDLYAENKAVEVHLLLDEPALLVQGDRQMMGRIVNNLIINGLQSVKKGVMPVIQVRVYKNTDKRFAIFEVRDNGEGIPEPIRNKVFMPNFSTKVGGSGLGLAMARRGIEHMGGNIWFETDDRTGTIFFVDIPLAPEQ